MRLRATSTNQLADRLIRPWTAAPAARRPPPHSSRVQPVHPVSTHPLPDIRPLRGPAVGCRAESGPGFWRGGGGNQTNQPVVASVRAAGGAARDGRRTEAWARWAVGAGVGACGLAGWRASGGLSWHRNLFVPEFSAVSFPVYFAHAAAEKGEGGGGMVVSVSAKPGRHIGRGWGGLARQASSVAAREKA